MIGAHILFTWTSPKCPKSQSLHNPWSMVLLHHRLHQRHTSQHIGQLADASLRLRQRSSWLLCFSIPTGARDSQGQRLCVIISRQTCLTWHNSHSGVPLSQPLPRIMAHVERRRRRRSRCHRQRGLAGEPELQWHQQDKNCSNIVEGLVWLWRFLYLQLQDSWSQVLQQGCNGYTSGNKRHVTWSPLGILSAKGCKLPP